MPKRVTQPTPHAAIGARLGAFRLALGHKKLGEYAEAAGIAGNTYSQNESGVKRIDVEPATKLKHRYGITLDWIYAGDPDALPYAVVAAMQKYLRTS